MSSFPTLCKRASFLLLTALILLLSVATWLEHTHGTAFVSRHIYFAPWFALLWGLLTLSGWGWLAHSRPLRPHTTRHRNLQLWLLHGAFTLILAGAGLSALTSRNGQIHLRLHTPERAYYTDGDIHHPVKLPFTIELQQFDIDFHAGTHTPRNFISRITVDGKPYEISMNRTVNVHGYRLFQHSYDSDCQGSVLMIRTDPWGRPLTYAGYALLCIAFLILLFSPHGGMAQTRKSLRRLTLIGWLLLPTAPLQARDDRPCSLPQEVSERFGSMYVSYGGRICQMQTLAQDFCRKLHGRPSYGAFTAEEVLAGWLCRPDDWNREPIIRLKNRQVRQQTGLKSEVSYNELRLKTSMIDSLYQAGRLSVEAATEAAASLSLIEAVREGTLFRIFPVSYAGRVCWMTPGEASEAASGSCANSTPSDSILIIKECFDRFVSQATAGNYQQASESLNRLKRFQQTHARDTLPTAASVQAERLYNAFDLPFWLSRFLLVTGGLLFLLSLRRTPLSRLLRMSFATTALLSLVALTAYTGLRIQLSGRLPFGNGYETMLAAAWFSLVAGSWLMWRKRLLSVLPCAPFLTAGFFLLVASLSTSGAEISQLVPVLNSPLLSLHVSLVMLAYTLLSFTFLISFLTLCLRRDLARARLQSLLLLYPALALLAAGIFTGAVWADCSWGRYWGWDPKEVWALVTLLVYALPVHGSSLPVFRSDRFFLLYLTLAFSTVLMTYFGVNYVLGGLHSYA